MAHVIITGGSSGIGAAIARLCAARGDAVSLIARSYDRLEGLRTTMIDAGAAAVAIEPADVADADAIAAAISRLEEAGGPCDLLVTSAGIVMPGRFDQQPRDDFEDQLQTNLFGTANAVRAVYPGMLARRRGRILMIGSGAGLIGIHGYSGYCASKAGLVGFAEALRLEARPFGVSISICFPPDTQTPQLAAELPLRPAEAKAMIGTAGVMSAEAVASIALSGADRGRFAIYPGGSMRLLGMFGSLAKPVLGRWHDRRIAALGRARR